MDEPTCPGCDGTITRAIQQGREVTTYERCERCREREDDVFDTLGDSLIVAPSVWRRGQRPPSSVGSWAVR